MSPATLHSYSNTYTVNIIKLTLTVTGPFSNCLPVDSTSSHLLHHPSFLFIPKTTSKKSPTSNAAF